MRQVCATKRMNRMKTSCYKVPTVRSTTLCLEWVQNRPKTDIELELELPEEAQFLGSERAIFHKK